MASRKRPSVQSESTSVTGRYDKTPSNSSVGRRVARAAGTVAEMASSTVGAVADAARSGMAARRGEFKEAAKYAGAAALGALGAGGAMALRARKVAKAAEDARQVERVADAMSRASRSNAARNVTLRVDELNEARRVGASRPVRDVRSGLVETDAQNLAGAATARNNMQRAQSYISASRARAAAGASPPPAGRSYPLPNSPQKPPVPAKKKTASAPRAATPRTTTPSTTPRPRSSGSGTPTASTPTSSTPRRDYFQSRKSVKQLAQEAAETRARGESVPIRTYTPFTPPSDYYGRR